MSAEQKTLTDQEKKDLLEVLEKRFADCEKRHPDLKWEPIGERLAKDAAVLWSLQQMEATGGEPDVLGYDSEAERYFFCDFSPETPVGRRNLCYDPEALESRKKNKPGGSAVGSALAMGIELMTEDQYRMLQEVEAVDCKTSSWIKTPEVIRRLGGALFCDRRYATVFVYHNGAESYYSSRGFRGVLKV